MSDNDNDLFLKLREELNSMAYMQGSSFVVDMDWVNKRIDRYRQWQNNRLMEMKFAIRNEYLRGWHDALSKALKESYNIHCEEGDFRVVQEETLIGLGLSAESSLGKPIMSWEDEDD